jgi:chromosome segregation ATPase
MQQVLEQELQTHENDSAQERAQWEKQTKEFLHRIAESQMKEADLREELSTKLDALTAENETGLAERKTLQEQVSSVAETAQQERERVARLEDDLRTAAHSIDELESQKNTMEQERSTLNSEIKALAHSQLEWKARELDLENAQKQLREAFNTMKTEMVQSQSQRNQSESEWTEKEVAWKKSADETQAKEAAWKKTEEEWVSKETAWKKAKEDWEKAPKMTVVEPGASGGTVEAGPEAVKALTAIRQQMQEMQTLLTWMRPAKKPLGKAA